MAQDSAEDETPVVHDGIDSRELASVPISRLERFAAGAVGAVVAGAGLAAVFLTDNEIGTAALLLAGAIFLLISIGFVPRTLKSGVAQIEWARAAREVLQDRLDSTSDEADEDSVVEDLEQEAGIVDPSLAVQSMLRRFIRFSGSSDPRAIHDGLIRRGWEPRLPPKSAYIRWVRPGKGRVSLFQNSRYLVTVAAEIREFASSLEGAKPRSRRNEVEFEYSGRVDEVLSTVDEISREVDRR